MNHVAAHLSAAVERHRRWCRDNGHSVPPELLDLVVIVSGGQAPSESAGDLDAGEDGGVAIALDYAEAGRLIGVSASTVYRLVRDGKLHAVSVGAAKRIPRSELERFVDEQLAQQRKVGELVSAVRVHEVPGEGAEPRTAALPANLRPHVLPTGGCVFGVVVLSG